MHELPYLCAAGPVLCTGESCLVASYPPYSSMVCHFGKDVVPSVATTFCWTTPSGRTYDAEPTRYPI